MLSGSRSGAGVARKGRMLLRQREWAPSWRWKEQVARMASKREWRRKRGKGNTRAVSMAGATTLESGAVSQTCATGKRRVPILGDRARVGGSSPIPLAMWRRRLEDHIIKVWNSLMGDPNIMCWVLGSLDTTVFPNAAIGTRQTPHPKSSPCQEQATLAAGHLRARRTAASSSGSGGGGGQSLIHTGPMDDLHSECCAPARSCQWH